MTDDNEELHDLRETIKWIHERARTEWDGKDPQRLAMVLATIEQSAKEVLTKHPNDDGCDICRQIEGPICGEMRCKACGHTWC